MVITRTRVNDHTIEGFTFHPGSQFVSDETYFKTLKENADFKAQVKAKFLVIEVPAADPNSKDSKKTAAPKKSLADTIVDLQESEAITIVMQTVDALDLKEIIKHDKRRAVVEAAEKQMEDRAQTLTDMAPKALTDKKAHPGDIKMDIVE